MAIRLAFLIIGSSVMTLTTTPNQLTDGLEKMLKPLNRIKVPVHEIAMMMSIALRFIPILFLHFAVQMTWQWRWRPAVTEEANIAQR